MDAAIPTTTQTMNLPMAEDMPRFGSSDGNVEPNICEPAQTMCRYTTDTKLHKRRDVEQTK
jgi:hypothetical protein